MPHTHANGIELYYELTGPADRPVILQFGGGLFGRHNFGLVNEGFRERFQLLSFDARGYGASGHPRERYTIEGWAADGAALLDAVELERVLVHGTSMGGMIAIVFAGKYPERTTSVVINCAAAKLGASRVFAVEVDPDALGNARDNIERNGVTGTVHLVEGDAQVLLPLLAPVDLVVANVENAAAGFGVTPALARGFLEGGVDVMTSGNHIWDKKEAIDYIGVESRLIRPANFPAGVPGNGSYLARTARGSTVGVINVMGRVFMLNIDDPFTVVLKEIEAMRQRIHEEARAAAEEMRRRAEQQQPQRDA